MRRDSIGFFWQDLPPEKKAKKEKPKRIPPEPVWIYEGYLPDLTGINLNLDVMTDSELLAAQQNKHVLVMDIESFKNYFLIVFTSLQTGKCIYEEMGYNETININKLRWVTSNFLMATFNGNKYDIPILTYALSGANCAQLKAATNEIIQQKLWAHQFLKTHKLKKLDINHIDLIEVAPLKNRLKVYGGRMHVPYMQDLPFPHDAVLTDPQKEVVRWYCYNDTSTTAFLYESLRPELNLRAALSEEHRIDLRSKSDAQIAEAIITKEITEITGQRIIVPEILPGTRFDYKIPHFIKFETQLMKAACDIIASANYIVNENGRIGLPKEVKALKLKIADNTYRMGIGGLHSSEKNKTLKSDNDYVLSDRDVKSYYPRIILVLGLFPKQLGRMFLHVFGRIVSKRLAAKESGLKIIAETLKIVINGTFGKLGNKFSNIYAPELLIRVTITGQLALLMLIERLELAGIEVASANTDGIVIRCLRTRMDEYNAIIAQWERDTGFETEETRYKALYIRDVNNYIAVKEKGGVKEKGAFGNPWARGEWHESLKKNPTNTICIEALEKFLSDGVSIPKTIYECEDITKFVTVRTVEGGAVKNGRYLGESIRWYYATGETGEIVYATSGNQVPRSVNAKPLMHLPKDFPGDIDYTWYEKEAYSMLEKFNAC